MKPLNAEGQSADGFPSVRPPKSLSNPSRRKILMMGARRAGKTSICKVIYESFQPSDTLFLTPTMRTQIIDIDAFYPLELWDVPGSMLMKAGWTGGLRAPVSSASAAPSTAKNSGTTASAPSDSTSTSVPNLELDVPWASVSALIFVIDAQDDYFDALVRLNALIITGFLKNRLIQVHVFINKVDGLSDDYKYDTQRDIEQRVYEGLIDSSHELQDILDDSTRLDQLVSLRFHLTSVFDSSVFVAFSRIQQQLMQGPSPTEKLCHSPAFDAQPMVSLSEALETACNLLCASCYFEKVYIFDVPSRTFVGCDTSPFDAPLFDTLFRYIQFLRQFSDLYANIPDADHSEPSVRTRDWSTSVMRLGFDTSVAFWQLNQYV